MPAPSDAIAALPGTTIEVARAIECSGTYARKLLRDAGAEKGADGIWHIPEAVADAVGGFGDQDPVDAIRETCDLLATLQDENARLKGETARLLALIKHVGQMAELPYTDPIAIVAVLCDRAVCPAGAR